MAKKNKGTFSYLEAQQALENIAEKCTKVNIVYELLRILCGYCANTSPTWLLWRQWNLPRTASKGQRIMRSSCWVWIRKFEWLKSRLLRYMRPKKSAFTLSKLRFLWFHKPWILSFYSFQNNKSVPFLIFVGEIWHLAHFFLCFFWFCWIISVL